MNNIHSGATHAGRLPPWLLAATFVAGLGALAPRTAQAGGVIFNSSDPAFQTVALGVNDAGNLNFIAPSFSTVNGSGGAVGLAARFPDGLFYDATSPGCLCEGWGLALTFDGVRVSGFASVDNGGSANLTEGTFGSTTTAATSFIGLSNAPVTITHAYGVSLAPGVFQGNITIRNTGTTVLEDLVYRRAMDWDVPPTDFNEYVSHYGVNANLESNGGNVRFASDNGFAPVNPLLEASFIDASTVNTDFVDSGVQDHGSVFDFAFGNLAPGESRTFNIFYGVAPSEAAADAAIAILQPNVWSYGQSALNLDSGGGDGGGCESECPELASLVVPEGDTGTLGPAPNDDGFTFIFAFGGVGGVEPGLDPETPVLPFVPAPGQFVFPAPVPRRWFDPPFAEGFEYSLEDGEFTGVMIPEGFGSLVLEVGGFSAILAPLVEFRFADAGLDDVGSFRIRGLSPLLDLADPGIFTAFPTFLDFEGDGPLTMTAIEVAPVPVPAALPLLVSGIALVGLRRRRRLH